jgi:lysophospholipase L1-like esterase
VGARFSRLRNGFLLALMGTALGLIAAEIAIRVFDPLGVSYYEEIARYQRDKLRNPERHQPGLRRTYQGVEMAFNELGFRDRPVEPRQPGELRVVVLGDSIALGWGVAASDTFGENLERRLRRRLARPVRTINTGVASYNTDQELRVLQRYGDLLVPDLVVLLYAQNDVNLRAWTVAHQGGALQSVRRIAGKSWLYRLLQHVRQYARWQPAPTPIDRTAPGWRNSMQAMAAIGRYCRAREIPLLAILARRHREPLNEALREDLSQLAARENFLFADALPWFEGRDIRRLTNSVVDRHLNGRGLDILAEATTRLIVDADLDRASATAAGRGDGMPP